MKSLNIIFPDKNIVIAKEEQIDKSVNSNEILCKADKSLISIGTELFCLAGIFEKGTLWESWVKYPFYPGYSMTAKVIKVGLKVARFKEGDRIFLSMPHKQYFKVRVNDSINIIPEGISSEEATWFGVATITQLGVRAANIQLGEKVGVIGLGLLGQLIIQYLKNLGASKIVGIDKIEKRLLLSKKYGATNILKTDIESAIRKVKEISENKMLDVVFDVTGNPRVLSYASRLLKKFGRLILIGDTPTPSKQYLGPNIVSDSIKIIGVHGRNVPSRQWDYIEMMRLFFEFLKQKKMNTKGLITNIYNPLDAPKVYENIKRDRSNEIGVIFDWDLVS